MALTPVAKLALESALTEPSAYTEIKAILEGTDHTNPLTAGNGITTGTDTVYYYLAGTNEIYGIIVFNSITYSAVPCEMDGFKRSVKLGGQKKKLKIIAGRTVFRKLTPNLTITSFKLESNYGRCSF